MDIYQVMVGLSNDPENYVEEYRQQLQSFEALVRLPKQPEKTIRQTLAFLLAHPRVDKRLPDVLADAVRMVKCHKTRSVIVNSFFGLKSRGLIGTDQLFRTLLEHCVDLKSVLKNAKREADEEAIPHLLNYYRKGTDKQRCFCYYLIVCLFMRGCSQLEKEVCEGLFAGGKIGRICMLYFLNQIDFEEESEQAMSLLSDEAAETGRRLFREIAEDKMERETKVMKMRIYVLFRARFGLKASVVPIAMGMVNPDKEDAKDLIRVIVDCVGEQDVMKAIDVVANGFCSEFRDDDFIAYGLNILREVYCKFDPRTRMEGCECSGEEEQENEEENPLVEKIRDRILNCVECFKGSKTKSIYYAHASVINAIKNKQAGRAPEFIMKKATREEKDASRQAGKKPYAGGKHSKGRRARKRGKGQ